jgi:hypothetical protein
MNNENRPRNIFRYNMSFYYKSTIIYFVVFVLYGVIRGEFVENSFTLITKDPVLYFIAIIVVISVAALLYNLVRNLYIEITDEGISFVDRFSTKKINISQIKRIKISRQLRTVNSKTFKTARLKVNSKIRPIIIRFSDFENQDELIKRLEELKLKIEQK